MFALGKNSAARVAANTAAATAGLAPVVAGPYPGAAGTEGSDAVAHDDAEIVAWASGVAELTRGPAKITDLSAGYAGFGAATDALGPSVSDNPDDVYDVVSLGDGGSITLTFDHPIRDGDGWDFAVFENGFTQPGSPTGFLELAFVEVSSDGVNFFRFPAVSLTQTMTQVGPFAWIDPTNLHNLAGKYAQGRGTPFDLAELAPVAAADPRLDLAAITHVRLVDVVGVINSPHTRHDSLGNAINDPWATTFTTGGFDLDAVAVRHVAAPPASGYASWQTARFTAEQLADPAVSGDAADPDGDGRANLLEYALATAPLAADATENNPAPGLDADGRLTLAYTRPAGRDDLAYLVEWSSNLADWYSSSEYVEQLPASPAPDGGELVTARAVAPAGDPPRQFLRLRVTRSAP